MSEKKGFKYYFGFGEVVSYFLRMFKGGSEAHVDGKKPTFNLRMMHGINKISILMFLVALIVMIVRRLTY